MHGFTDWYLSNINNSAKSQLTIFCHMQLMGTLLFGFFMTLFMLKMAKGQENLNTSNVLMQS